MLQTNNNHCSHSTGTTSLSQESFVLTTSTCCFLKESRTKVLFSDLQLAVIGGSLKGGLHFHNFKLQCFKVSHQMRFSEIADARGSSLFCSTKCASEDGCGRSAVRMIPAIFRSCSDWPRSGTDALFLQLGICRFSTCSFEGNFTLRLHQCCSTLQLGTRVCSVLLLRG